MSGEKITVESGGQLNVPNHPIIPFIEGDGIGVDIWPVAKKLIDAAVEISYGGEKKMEWKEILVAEARDVIGVGFLSEDIIKSLTRNGYLKEV